MDSKCCKEYEGRKQENPPSVLLSCSFVLDGRGEGAAFCATVVDQKLVCCTGYTLHCCFEGRYSPCKLILG